MQTTYDLDTPSLIVDLDVMDANLARLQHYCDMHDMLIGLRGENVAVQWEMAARGKIQ